MPVGTANVPLNVPETIQPMNVAPPEFDPLRDLPEGFLDFLEPLDRMLSGRQQQFVRQRAAALTAAQEGRLPTYLPPSDATVKPWSIALPVWCQDQRNQMTGPADDAELVVKMLNSGAPGVMLDLEDSVANTWTHVMKGVSNALSALRGELSFYDKKRNRTVAIQPSNSAIFIRPRGLHIHQ